MAFHWKDNWYFERKEDGVVRIYHLDNHGIADEDIEIDASSWVSIIASVSRRGDTSAAHLDAFRLHIE